MSNGVWLAQLLVAQAEQQATGPFAELTRAIYAVGGVVTALGALFGVDKVAFWRQKKRGNNGVGTIGKVVAANERLAESMERLDQRLEKIHDICTRLEDRSR